MVCNEEVIAKSLEAIIDRLEEARSNSLLEVHQDDALYTESIDMDSDTADYMEGMESALVVMESRINYLADMIAEEIDNLRSLMEKLNENP